MKQIPDYDGRFVLFISEGKKYLNRKRVAMKPP